MNWLRKSLLWASVGCCSAATATAQTLAPRPEAAPVVICRPQPLTAPATATITVTVGPPAAPPRAAPTRVAPRPATVPAIIVRAHMEELPDRILPSAAELADAQLRTAVQLIPDVPLPLAPASTPPSAEPALADANRLPVVPAVPEAWLGAPQSAPQSHPWTGLTVDVPAGTASVVVYDMGPTGIWGAPAANATFYGRAEYLSWWTKGDRLPILVTTAPATTDENFRGTLGVPGTVPLFGGDTTNQGPQSGARFTIGYRPDPCSPCSIEADYFFLGPQHDNFFADSSQYPVLARPFFNVNIGAEDRQLTATPGILPADAFMLRGSITVNNFSNLQGGDINLRNCLCSDCNYSLSGLAGFRFLDLRDGVSITENVVSAAAVAGFPNFTPGNQIIVNDSFATRNLFYGGQFGFDGEYRMGKWFIGACAELGLGVTNETISINGSQTVTTLAGADDVCRRPAGAAEQHRHGLAEPLQRRAAGRPARGLQPHRQCPRLRRLRLPLLEQCGPRRRPDRHQRQRVAGAEFHSGRRQSILPSEQHRSPDRAVHHEQLLRPRVECGA